MRRPAVVIGDPGLHVNGIPASARPSSVSPTMNFANGTVPARRHETASTRQYDTVSNPRMQPLNPFLRAFFRSALPSQCSPVQQHVLLVPTTEVLFTSKDRDTNIAYAELCNSEEFLASHALRAQQAVGSRPVEGSNIRENKSKAKQYTTINGRTVVIKDAYVYSNKGFKTLNQALILNDALFYPPDSSDGQQWLIYYISRPLLGTFQSTPIVPAVISDEPSRERRRTLAEASGSSSETTGEKGKSKKKDVKSFADLMNQYPMISRQMQAGLERLIREFVSANDSPVTKQRTRGSSVSSQRSTPSLSESVSSLKSSLSGGSRTVHPTTLELEPEEEKIRTSFETTVVAAIALFQGVDKAQLKLLGSSTELTGPLVERMLERYVAEQVHDQTLFPAVCAVHKAEDGDLDGKIRKLTDIDIAQVGIPYESGMKGKRSLAVQLKKGVEMFRKMGVSSSPQEMLEILLDAQKIITAAGAQGDVGLEKRTPLTINADDLVSMLLIVVIRSGVRHLHARLLYMRYFIFCDEVESGEQGYALATLEAVVAHLSTQSAGLRRISKRNRALWHATRSGDIKTVQAILQPETGEEASYDLSGLSDSDSHTLTDTTDRDHQLPDLASPSGSLGHVFPFQRPPTPPPEIPRQKTRKRVSMASLPRSLSISSEFSSASHSRTMSVDSESSFGGDLSTDKLAQTQDSSGNSVLMMAVDAGRRSALKTLLAMPSHFRVDFVLDDSNAEGTTLLSAAIASGNRPIAEDLLEYLERKASDQQFTQYLQVQDAQGRSAAHYLFHQPHLLRRLSEKIPWRLKDKNGQTPLFALCRSYDNEEYHNMVLAGMDLATEAQGDGQPLHLDDHVDAKGNTLLHVVTDMPLVLKLLRQCDADVNAANDKRFTPLMTGSKYGRVNLVRALFRDPRVDMTLRDLRGLTAVELAKDDDVRNRIDDLVLLSTPPDKDGRSTKVVRSFFVEDATVRLVIKSGAVNPSGSVTVSTCRRSVSDFENLAKYLALECPASWMATTFNLQSPFLIPTKPAKAVLRDTQYRLDNFLRNLLTHGTFHMHEMVWEFFLVPELDAAMMEERSKRKAEARVDNVKDDYEPIQDTHEVENFVAYVRDQMRSMTNATKKAMRAINRSRQIETDVSDAQHLASSRMSSVLFLPPQHVRAFERYGRTLVPSEASPLSELYYQLHAVATSSAAIQVALNRPAYLIGSMAQAQRSVERSLSSLSRSNRWTPNIGIFEDTKKAVARDAWDKAGKARREKEMLGCELRYTQQTVANELATWQDEHVKAGRRLIRQFAMETLVKEKNKLDNLRRAIRVLCREP